MRNYIQSFKNIKFKKHNNYIIKRRIHTLDTLTDNDLMDIIDENDIECERYDIIPNKAEKLYQKKLAERKRKEAEMKKSKNKNGKELNLNTNYFQFNYKNPIMIRNETPEYFLNKYKTLLENQNHIITNSDNIEMPKLNNNEKKENIKKRNSVLSNKIKIETPEKNTININKTLNDNDREFYKKYIKKKQNKKLYLLKNNTENNTENNTISKNKTQSITISLQNSPKKNDYEKEKPIIIKTKNQEYLDQPKLLRNKEKLVKLNEKIFDYENSRYFDSKVGVTDKQVYFSEQFVRPSFTKFQNIYKEKIPTKSLVKKNITLEQINRPQTHKNKFKNFDKLFKDILNNNIKNQLLNEKISEIIDINRVEPNPNKWIDDIDSYLNKIIINYYKDLGVFLYNGKKGIYSKHDKNIKKGDKTFKEGIRLSQREKNI